MSNSPKERATKLIFDALEALAQGGLSPEILRPGRIQFSTHDGCRFVIDVIGEAIPVDVAEAQASSAKTAENRKTRDDVRRAVSLATISDALVKIHGIEWSSQTDVDCIEFRTASGQRFRMTISERPDTGFKTVDEQRAAEEMSPAADAGRTPRDPLAVRYAAVLTELAGRVERGEMVIETLITKTKERGSVQNPDVEIRLRKAAP